MSNTDSDKYSEENVQLARFAKAMGHPARLMILRMLGGESCCFCGDIVQDLPIAQSTVSQHLKELKDVGLIQGEINPPKIRYCINKDNWQIAKTLMDDFFE
ncbi:MAG: metalloregulator ArsR/SmtB family transcription factor [Candidatus Kapabacteria bacterium]|nr:metalloregulator ArsR/SmtB family transcription factor [Candidatus Kapabacteria bacterium]